MAVYHSIFSTYATLTVFILVFCQLLSFDLLQELMSNVKNTQKERVNNLTTH